MYLGNTIGSAKASADACEHTELELMILEKAPAGVRISDVPGSRHKAKRALDCLVEKGNLIKRTLVDRSAPIYFDNKDSARAYFKDKAGLQPLAVLRVVKASPEILRIQGTSYEPLDTTKLSSGWVQHL